MKNCCEIYGIRRNAYSAWVITGEYGIKTYYYYTKDEAVKLYCEQSKNDAHQIVTCQK